MDRSGVKFWILTFSTISLIYAGQLPAQSGSGRFDHYGQCVGDRNNDGQVTVDELVTGVNNLLDGCGFVPVNIRFAGFVGEQPFQCGMSYPGVGTSQAEFVPSDFRFYVSNVRLLTTDDREVPVLLDQDGIWQLEDIALVDFEDKNPPCVNGTVQTNNTLRGRVAPGNYNGIRFTLGVPFRRNHGDASVAPAPLSLTAMFWSWQAGYKFLRVDTALDNYRIHLGSTGCYYASPGVVGGCARPNRAEIVLRPFDVEHDMIVADLAALLSDSDLRENVEGTPPGCMSDPADTDCGPVLRNLGVDFASGLPVPGLQKFFRVMSQH
ncbi:MAG: hypothetical protein KatS3mg077_0376 [Candidatus Binatia bacterium]|nr:MAG: hypothetical protein KatS3mg077_0376 [Candidatus Binatia bacterium]